MYKLTIKVIPFALYTALAIHLLKRHTSTIQASAEKHAKSVVSRKGADMKERFWDNKLNKIGCTGKLYRDVHLSDKCYNDRAS